MKKLLLFLAIINTLTPKVICKEQMKTIEIEMRYEVLDENQVDSFVKNLSFRKTKNVCDVYWDTESGDLVKKGIYIRVRDKNKLDIKFNRACLDNSNLEIQAYCEEHSFKLPLTSDDLERLNKVSASISLNTISKNSLELFKTTNNLVELCRVDKTRTSYSLDNFSIEVDSVKGLGAFLEIELMTKDTSRLKEVESQMKQLLMPLSLKRILTGYPNLMLRKQNFKLYLQSRFVLEEDKIYT